MINNREIFKKTMALFKLHPWIEEIEEEFCTLLFEDCTNDKEKELIFNLVNSFFYMTHSNYIKYIEDIANEIIKYDCSETVIFATAFDRQTDSSQEISYILKSKIARSGGKNWIKPNLYGNMSKSVLKDQNEDKIKNIFIVDEFNGSGKTIISRYRKICKDLKEKGKYPEDYNIKFFYISSIYEACIYVEEEGISLDTKEILAKGISDNSIIKDKDEAKAIINKMSEILSPKILDEDMFPLGYNDAEALYYRENGNTPNSVFPIFWWPEYKSGKERRPFITRGF